MNFQKTYGDRYRWVAPDDQALSYTGRIDFSEPKVPLFIYAYSSVTLHFRGTGVKVLVRNHNQFWRNFVGFVLDGETQEKLEITNCRETACLPIAENLENKAHELILFKRMDSCHYFDFYGFLLDPFAEVLEPAPKPVRRMECFGDSVSCGEVSEALDYVGKPDPAHEGEYSNAWYSFPAITARTLGAQLHDTSQGGIALMDGIGYFCEPDALGMESCYDKLRYNPLLGEQTPWDFSRYTPHVVLVAVGQNDSHPVNFISTDPAARETWKRHYIALVQKLRGHYPDALILLMTTILEHDPGWDECIGEAAGELGDPKVKQFLFSRNGRGTPGHIRILEAQEMAAELTAFIRSFGEEIWAG